MSILRLALVTTSIGAVACGPFSTSTGPEAYDYRYEIPVSGPDGWETASLSDVGLRGNPLAELMSDLHALGEHRIHSLLIVRQGKLVFEEYFNGLKTNLARYTGESGFDREDTHNLASVTKSITTTLFGIALDRGHFDGVDLRVFDFFPDHADLLAEDSRREGITIEHLMLMTSGMRWNDEVIPYTEPENDMVRMFTSDDPIGFALATPLYALPGTDFEYCNANTNILGEVVARVTGQRLDAFSRVYLFDPLGITDFEWQMISPDVVFASGDLRLRPRDMAKIGLLFLEQGLWKGQRVVSAEWVRTATSRLVSPDGPHAWADGYGYGWWHWDLTDAGKVHPAFMASGWGGQWIVVLPEDDMVFVTTGGSFFDPVVMPADRILTDYILPATR
jgi:CubicO group peptidase (beta-lactamase class C family)